MDDLARWATDFERFHARFAAFFARSEAREHARHYLRGLLSPVQRKNTWQMAEALGLPDPQGLQRLLYSSPWDADAACLELQRFVVEQFGHPEGIVVLDETAFIKKGTQSVGVQRQWCSPLGKTENCQVGVFAAYVSERGYAFLDRRLYLPEDWSQDAARRQAAQVPQTVTFQTKPQLAKQMLERLWERGVPMRWVTGDERYGDAPHLRDRIAGQGLGYVLAISSSTVVWEQPPLVEPPGPSTGGRPRQHPRLAVGAPKAESVATVVARWPAERWHRLAIAAGEKGPRLYDWAAGRVLESREGLPGAWLWLLARRSIAKPGELAYYFSNAPAGTPLLKLAQVAGARWTIEQCFEEGKGEAGLDEYEVRSWHSWHRHITLSLMAHAFLTWVRRKEREARRGEKGAPRLGGSECGRGAALAGSGPPLAAALGRVQTGLVALAARQAPASAPQSPSAARCLLAGRS